MSINKKLIKRQYLQYYSCRKLITKNDTKSIHYKKGVSMPLLYKERTIKQIQSSQTRQDQINLAELRIHPFRKIY